MFCVTCQNNLERCACPDRNERINKLRGFMALRWCRNCDSWAPLCHCDEPDHFISFPVGRASVAGGKT